MNPHLFRIYRAVDPQGGWLGKVSVFVADRPGSLASLAGLFGGLGINITFFHHNRSEHPNRVILEVTSPDEQALPAVRRLLEEGDYFDPEPRLELGVLDAGNILKLEVRLEHRPGTLGEFASLLRDHGVNLIFMSYDEDICATSADVSLVTRDPGEIDRLLRDLNERGYPYTLQYRGAEQKEVEDIIGLNLVERFFFRLQRLLGTEDVERLRRLVDSSRRISDTLVRFSREAGQHLEAGEVLTKVLAFASASLSRTGPNFTWRRHPPLVSGCLTFHAFRLPTGSNLFLLEGGGELVMIDGGYGHYFEDVKRMLREEGFDPAAVRRIFLTHPDADHAGLSGWFAEEFGSRVFLHPRSREVIASENRIGGSDSRLLELNHWFTVLVNEFTHFRVPDDWTAYGGGEAETVDGFRRIDRFTVGGEDFEVLESAGGHIPGQVFFLGREAGLVFTGDFLLATDTLSREDQEILNLPRFMVTSTNADSRLFREEMESLRRLIIDFDLRLRSGGRRAYVVPGHGDWYEAERLNQT